MALRHPVLVTIVRRLHRCRNYARSVLASRRAGSVLSRRGVLLLIEQSVCGVGAPCPNQSLSAPAPPVLQNNVFFSLTNPGRLTHRCMTAKPCWPSETLQCCMTSMRCIYMLSSAAFTQCRVPHTGVPTVSMITAHSRLVRCIASSRFRSDCT